MLYFNGWRDDLQVCKRAACRAADIDMAKTINKRHQCLTVLAFASTLWIASTPSGAAIKLNAIFSDNAVLQMGQPIPVFGSGDNGDQVTVKLDWQTATTTVVNGRWMVRLYPMKAGGPYTLQATAKSGAGSTTVTNVKIGEVWLVSDDALRQSPLSAVGTTAAGAQTVDPDLRIFKIAGRPAPAPSTELPDGCAWTLSDDTAAQGSDALAYLFASELRQALKTPVGLIDASAAGSAISEWVNPAIWKAFAMSPETRKLLDTTSASSSAAKPGGLYNGILAPMAPFGIRGAVIRQGDADIAAPAPYPVLLSATIAGWRNAWGEGFFPVLIAGLGVRGDRSAAPQATGAVLIREAQRRVALSSANAYVAPAIDGPGDVAMAHRLALIALSQIYEQKIDWQGPQFASDRPGDRKIVVTFDNASGLATSDGAAPGCFAIAGPDGKYLPADGALQGDSVTLSNAQIRFPVSVRYDWYEHPSQFLINAAKQPAPPFRTDNLPLAVDASGSHPR